MISGSNISFWRDVQAQLRTTNGATFVEDIFRWIGPLNLDTASWTFGFHQCLMYLVKIRSVRHVKQLLRWYCTLRKLSTQSQQQSPFHLGCSSVSHFMILISLIALYMKQYIQLNVDTFWMALKGRQRVAPQNYSQIINL